MIMKCPICGMDMELKGQDVSNNLKNGVQYDRSVFLCIPDDTWVTVESPIAEAAEEAN